jgi:hypothetical protein
LIVPADLVAASAFPLQDNFDTVGASTFGRAKFIRANVKAFSPASPGGDGNALFITNYGNTGSGWGTRIYHESVVVGRPRHRNYYVQSDVYLLYRGNGSNGYERYGIFLRDDGMGGMDRTFEGSGNAYVMCWDCDDGRLRCGRVLDGAISDLRPTSYYYPVTGWHTFRIEAQDDQIRYLLDGLELANVTDTNLPSGPCGIGYSDHFNSPPSDRGACFDNFIADEMPSSTVTDWPSY